MKYLMIIAATFCSIAAAFAQTPPTMAELQEAWATCNLHRAPPPIVVNPTTGLPKSVPPQNYWQPGWQNCDKIGAAVSAATAANRDAGAQQSINDLVKRLGQ
jgi:hypothetical protein